MKECVIPIPSEISALVRSLIADLVAGDYAKIEADGRLGRLTKHEVSEAIKSYLGTLSLPDIDAFDSFDVYEVQGKKGKQWVIDFDLWYDKKKSDLTLGATIEKDKYGVLSISIDDIHVL